MAHDALHPCRAAGPRPSGAVAVTTSVSCRLRTLRREDVSPRPSLSAARVCRCAAQVAVAAGKHHMVAATSSGELFSWGSNRGGQLGYTSPDNQPTPRK